MRSAEITIGRRIAVALDPGDEVLEALTKVCAEHGIRQATIPVFSGALRSARFIAAHTPVQDQEPPLPQEVTVTYTEGIGSGMVMWDETDQRAVPHLHVALGVKNTGATGYAGHLLGGEVHYTAEVVIEEVLTPALLRVADARAYGIATLHFG
ncbi:PPC domain-containing DNA-binding protein [Cellulomonas denverensis]|uniref:DNA-binding protein n=1 Tax=Cellulomonas denverensis TaxID=264297 RepID=A0A7X6KV03_9CELL|nr:PPC domain-containing DNA-binding protein [Cellulomonas denverensis]NKY22638.1 DNA-binding protein [Cellulomonas denverensis]GIG24713.1 hypothetical protein Cde04nite_09570 [Cellulomonas denverensis]